MRRLLTWILIAVGIAAIVRRLRRKGELETSPGDVGADDPADELRRKLAETRSGDEASESSAEATVEERRADVHEQGRSAIAEMEESAET